MTTKTTPLNPLEIADRGWNEFAYFAYARTVARKHGIVVPDIDLGSLTDEELDKRIRLLADLAHLPPG